MSEKIRIIKDVRIGQDGFFTRKLTDYLNFKSHNSQWPRSKVIRPSEVTMCLRHQVMSILRLLPDEEIPPKLQRIFDNGISVHKRYLRSYIPRMGIACKVTIFERGRWVTKDFIEISIQHPEYWLRGAPDAVILNEEDRLPYIFELKSMKQEYFQALSHPSWDYIAQVHLYMFMTGIPRAIIVYENKNDQDLKEFKIFQDQNTIAFLIERIKTIQNYVLSYVVTKELPPRCNDKYCTACKL